MSEQNPANYIRAVHDFRSARRKARLQKIFNRFSRKSDQLLDYEDIKKKLQGIEGAKRVLKEIPLDSIVGSVGRYRDFTRTFLPQKDTDEERWARVQVAMQSGIGLPPIEVYQIGEVYFVRDGNHRVSVAREFGMNFIEAYVREVKTKAPLTPEDSPEDLIIKIEYTNFLENTDIDELRPQADLSTTVTAAYPILEEHISVHRYFMGVDQDREISQDEAVEDWYDQVYLPIVETIREHSILTDFPGRTETDLYLWLTRHRTSLEEALDWQLDLEQVIENLAEEKSKEPDKVISRVTSKLQDVLTPDPIEPGPAPGKWRKRRRRRRKKDRMFSDVLAPIRNDDRGWKAFDQAIQIAQRENGRLRGLYVVPTEEGKRSELARSIEKDFIERCQNAQIEYDFAIDVGGIARKIAERARWNDLVVLHLAHPPSNQPLVKLSSGFRTLVQRSPTPILAVKDQISEFNQGLLAYDGSPKAKEALYVASYFASRWGMPVIVLVVGEQGTVATNLLTQAGQYLGLYGAQVKLIRKDGKVAEKIIETSDQEACDLIIMGGYGRSPVVEVVLGSAVEQVMRESVKPILFCR